MKSYSIILSLKTDFCYFLLNVDILIHMLVIHVNVWYICRQNEVDIQL